MSFLSNISFTQGDPQRCRTPHAMAAAIPNRCLRDMATCAWPWVAVFLGKSDPNGTLKVVLHCFPWERTNERFCPRKGPGLRVIQCRHLG